MTSTGLTQRQYNTRENFIKGRIAETIVQEMFLSSGYSVFKYGMEHSVPGITGLLNRANSEVSKQIRNMPDFVILKDNTPYFIEVKFRASASFELSNMPPEYPYNNAFIVLVSTQHIKCISYAELKEGKKITPTCRNYIGYRKEFNLDKQVVIDFCDFVNNFFITV